MNGGLFYGVGLSKYYALSLQRAALLDEFRRCYFQIELSALPQTHKTNTAVISTYH